MLIRLPILFSLLISMHAHAFESIQLEINDLDFTIDRFKADDRDISNHLILSIAQGFGTTERLISVAQQLALRGIEVWHVNLLENLFIPESTSAMRELDGSYVAVLIREANNLTGKKITLLSRDYGAFPVLRGAHQWQLANQGTSDTYLTGAILFSPEFYSAIPHLGLDPIYDPIISATNVPMMYYQAGKRGNRWQMENRLQKLAEGGSTVYSKILPGVTGVLYHEDVAEETYAALKALPDEIPKVLDLLEQTPTPGKPKPIVASETINASPGLDLSLMPYQGNQKPIPIHLNSANGEPVAIDDFTGKVTVVNFWATWCPPCVEEIPSLNRLRERMKGKEFDLISVNYAETSSDVDAFLSEVDIDFPVLLDVDGRFSAKWNVLIFPSTFIISPDGVIVYGVNGAIEWDSDEVVTQLEALLTANREAP